MLVWPGGRALRAALPGAGGAHSGAETDPNPTPVTQAMSACFFGRAGARCVRPYQELEAHCEESGERFPLLAMRLACGALTRALQPPAPRGPAARHPWRGDPLAVRFQGRFMFRN